MGEQLYRQLTCLMLPNKHDALLSEESIQKLDEKQKSLSLAERMLRLQPLDVNLFQGFTEPDAPRTTYIFGGQFIGQALAAASKTVDCLKTSHHFQAYFLLAGDLETPVKYNVKRLRDGKSFATRRVDAMQKGNIVFTLLASFQKEQKGFEHQTTVMPSVPPPDQLLSLEELLARPISDPRIPRSFRNKTAVKTHIPWPIDARFCAPKASPNWIKFTPSLKYWFRAKGKLPDDQSLHRCVIALASDLLFIQVSSYPHRGKGMEMNILSLNHTMWFHRPVKADDWILFVIESPTTSDGRGFCEGKMFNKKGEHIVSLTQEGVVREAKQPNAALRAKY